MSENPARDLIAKVGIFGLCHSDGCPCIAFEVHRIAVDVSCRKSSGMDGPFPDFFGIGIRVHSHSLDVHGPELRAVAFEVATQLRDYGYAIKVRYCDYAADSECKCIYCSKPRGDVNKYLCDECEVKPNPWGDGPLADIYDMRKFEFYMPEPEAP